jgi:hypothetical protein
MSQVSPEETQGTTNKVIFILFLAYFISRVIAPSITSTELKPERVEENDETPSRDGPYPDGDLNAEPLEYKVGYAYCPSIATFENRAVILLINAPVKLE